MTNETTAPSEDAEMTAEPAASTLTWLIERRTASFPVFYLVAEHYGGLDWTEDPHKAQRFPAEEWARKLIDRTVLNTFDDLHIAEHMFIAEPVLKELS